MQKKSQQVSNKQETLNTIDSKTSKKSFSKTFDKKVLNAIVLRAHYLATQMIYQANHRTDKEKGDPKIGGHASSSASSLHILGALHLIVKSGYDHIANKPHASPTDHAYNYLLNLFLKEDLSHFSLEERNQAMMGLRAFSKNGEPVFQSYHSSYDPDCHNFFPSGTVGIPPVNAGYMALAYRFAKEQGYEVPEAHFWSIIGDSEFREGSLHEALPDLSQRELGCLTWIIDYNRQSLDGHRIINERNLGGSDSNRIEKTMKANGWHVIQLQHGKLRQESFKKPGGDVFKQFLETELEDYKFQALLLVKDMKSLKDGIIKEYPKLKTFLDLVSEEELYQLIHDLAGHDLEVLVEAMEEAKKNKNHPSVIIAHTIKGWNLRCAATPGNHSALPSKDELEELQKAQGIKELFEPFVEGSLEFDFLSKRSEELYKEIKHQNEIKEKNKNYFLTEMKKFNEFPSSLEINTKMASYPHTQWMLGQLTAKITRIANTPTEENDLAKGQKLLSEAEKPWKIPSELFIAMAPDVGTSTNLNPAMDGKIFGASIEFDPDVNLGTKEDKSPDLIPGEDPSDRFLRFEIEEGNTMSCVGSFGRMRDVLGIPLIPLMTVYDFFIKRALDQYFYNLYWKSSFICVGTPAGVTLSPEGAQHGWKSDFQIPNQITWEPFFCLELDWILCDAIQRHLFYENAGRTGVHIRGTTRGIEQKDLLTHLKKQARFKEQNSQSQLQAQEQGQGQGKVGEGLLCHSSYPMENARDEATLSPLSDKEILSQVREEVLKGAYYLIDYRGYAGYEMGDNVVNIFTMGSLTTEGIKASEDLLAKGIYANVIVVTSPDLLCGHLAHENNYHYLKNELKLNGDLYFPSKNEKSFSSQLHSSSEDQTLTSRADFVTISGRRVPIVSVHDGEAGLLDNLGSIVGVKQEALAVRKHSKCGRPTDVYGYHHIDSKAVVEACKKVLTETAFEKVELSKHIISEYYQ